MAQAIRGVSNNIKKISLSNYSLTTQIIIINILTAILGCIFLLLINYLLISNNIGATSWPTESWEKTDAVSVGMNHDSLEAYSNILKSGSLGYIDGMLVTRMGKIIFEEEYTNNYDSLYRQTKTLPGKYNYYDSNWHPYYKDTKLHTMQSVSKSFTSTAIAIANKNGHIPDLNAKIMDYLGDYKSAIPDPRRNDRSGSAGQTRCRSSAGGGPGQG